jgi:5'-3' exonuclease
MSKTFKHITQVDSTLNTVLVVDSLNLAFRFKHQGAVTFLDEYIKTVESLKRSYKANDVIILSDWGASSYRREIYPEYKQNRKALQEQQTPEEEEYFKLFFKEYLTVIDYYQNHTDYKTFRFQGVEADDIAAHLVNNKNKYGLDKLWLVSSDKDYDLLIQPNVSRFSYVTRKEVTHETWDEHYEVTQSEYISMKCLVGDTGDNIPGIHKVGPKTAEKLIKQYGDAFTIADSIPLPGKYVYIKNLNEFGKDNILRNYQLMDLLSFCDDAIGVDNIKIIEDSFKEGN